jgi:benzoate membrane transport protein
MPDLRGTMKTLLKDCSVSAVVAGFIATVISYAGPLVIIFQAAKAADLSHDVLSSWIWAISIGSGVLGLVLSLRYKVPVIIAWSAPGSALLVTLLPGISLNEVVGAYLVSSLIILLVGLSGTFDTLIGKLPAAISAAMLAGILFRFGTDLFVSMQEQPWLVLAMLMTYLLCKRLLPRYAVLAVLVVGVLGTLGAGELRSEALVVGLATPQCRLAARGGGTYRAVRAGYGRAARRGLPHTGQPVDQQQCAGLLAAGAVLLPRA